MSFFARSPRFAAGLVALSAAASAQSTLYVDDDHPGDPTPGVSGLGFPFSNPSEDGTSALPFDDIQKAIDAAQGGDTILVRPSNHFGAYSLTPTFGSLDTGGKAVTIRSTGGAALTAIDGSLLAGAPGVRIDSGEGAGTVLEGFTLLNCDSGSQTGANGGALRVSGASPTIRACTFRSNRAYIGGGVYVAASNARFEDCRFESNHVNHQGGAVYTNDGTPTFTRCTFEGNSAGYAGAFISRTDASTSVVVEDCLFRGNASTITYGGGLAKFDSGAITVRRCRFLGNVSPGDGSAILLNGGGRVVDCEVNGNTSMGSPGGAVAIGGSGTAELVGCTIVHNQGGGVTEQSGIIVGRVRNSIVWDNDTYQIGVNVSVGHTNVMGGYGGAGNLDVDPLFANAAGPDGVRGTLDDDLSLLPGSPCIDAGDTLLVATSYPKDLAGRPRAVDRQEPDAGVALVGQTVDMGALELQPEPCIGVRGIVRRP